MGRNADYMNTPEKVKKGRKWMCNAQSEKVIGDKNLTGIVLGGSTV